MASAAPSLDPAADLQSLRSGKLQGQGQAVAPVDPTADLAALRAGKIQTPAAPSPATAPPAPVQQPAAPPVLPPVTPQTAPPVPAPQPGTPPAAMPGPAGVKPAPAASSVEPLPTGAPTGHDLRRMTGLLGQDIVPPLQQPPPPTPAAPAPAAPARPGVGDLRLQESRVHTGLQYPQEVSGEGPGVVRNFLDRMLNSPVGRFVSGFVPYSGLLHHTPEENNAAAALRIGLMQANQYPRLPGLPGKTEAEQKQEISEKNDLIRILSRWGGMIDNRGRFKPPPRETLDMGGGDEVVGARAAAQGLTPWQRRLLPVVRQQLAAELKIRQAVENPIYLRALLVDTPAMIAGIGAHHWAQNALIQKFGPLMGRSIVDLLMQPGNRLASIATRGAAESGAAAVGGAAAGGVGGGAQAALQGQSPAGIAREAGRGAARGAAIGGVLGFLGYGRDVLRGLGGGAADEAQARTLSERAAETARSRGYPAEEVEGLRQRAEDYFRAPAALKPRLLAAMQERVRFLEARNVTPPPEDLSRQAGAPEASGAVVPRPAEGGPTLRGPDGSEISLRHRTPAELHQIATAAAASGHPEVAAQAQQWLDLHEAHQAHQRPEIPIENRPHYVNESSKAGVRPLGVAKQMRSTAERFRGEDPDLAEKLLSAAHQAEADFQRGYHKREVEDALHPAAPPVPHPQVSAWRRLSPDQKARVPAAVRENLVSLDVSNSLQVEDPTHPGVHRLADIPGKPKTLAAAERIADGLFEKAQTTMAAHPAAQAPAPAEGIAVPPAAPAPVETPGSAQAPTPVETPTAPVQEPQPQTEPTALTAPETTPAPSPAAPAAGPPTASPRPPAAPGAGLTPKQQYLQELREQPLITDLSGIQFRRGNDTPTVQENYRALKEAAPGHPLTITGFRQDARTGRIPETGTFYGTTASTAGGYGHERTSGDVEDILPGGAVPSLTVERLHLQNPLIVEGGHRALVRMLESDHDLLRGVPASPRAAIRAAWAQIARRGEPAYALLDKAIARGVTAAGYDGLVYRTQDIEGLPQAEVVDLSALRPAAPAAAPAKPKGGVTAFGRTWAEGKMARTRETRVPHEMGKAEFVQQYGDPRLIFDPDTNPLALPPVAPSGVPGIHLEQTAEPGKKVNERHVLVYRDAEGKTRGMLAFTALGEGKGDKTASITGLYVDPALRGKGIGTQLQDALEASGYTQPPLARRHMTPDGAALYHARAVREALAQGKPVPDNVLADYPKLAAQLAEGRRPGGTIDAATGLGNRAAWDATARGKAVAVVHTSHPTAPVEPLLHAVGDSLRQAGLGDSAFHLGNGEFRVTADDPQDLAKALGLVRAELAESQVVSSTEGTHPRGIEVTYGIGKSEGAAERAVVREPAVGGAAPGAAAAVRPAGAGGGGAERAGGGEPVSPAAGGSRPRRTARGTGGSAARGAAAGQPGEGGGAPAARPAGDTAPAPGGPGLAEKPVPPGFRPGIYRPGASTAKPKPAAPTFENPQLEQWFQESNGPLTPPKPESWVRQRWNQLTRKRPSLPEDAYHKPFSIALDRLADAPERGKLEAVIRMSKAVGSLTLEEYGLFARYVNWQNLAENSERDIPNPPMVEGLGPQALADEGRALQAKVAINPKVEIAANTWREEIDRSAADYAKSKTDIGQPEPTFDRKDWFHQEFLAPVMEEQRAAARGGRARVKADLHPDFTLRREGGANFHTDPIQAHFEALTRMIVATEQNKVVKLLQTPEEQGGYNAMPRFKAQQALSQDKAAQQWFNGLQGAGGGALVVTAVPESVGRMAAAGMLPDHGNQQYAPVIDALAQNWALNEQAKAAGQPPVPLDPDLTGKLSDYANWIKEITAPPTGGGKAPAARFPEGYVPYRFVEGHTLYRARSLPQKLAQELIDGVVQQLSVTRSDLKPILAVGRSPDALLLREGVATAAENLRKGEPNPVDQDIRRVMRTLKLVGVLNPEHTPALIKEHLAGSALTIARANPGIFKEMPGAISDMWAARARGQTPSDIYRRFLFAGGGRDFRTTLGTVGEDEAFNQLAKFAADTRNTPQKVLQFAGRLVMAGRIPVNRLDEMARFAIFRDVLGDIERNGGPTKYLAARPDLAEAIGRVNGPDALAYYLSDQTMGPYGDMPQYLQALRDKVPSAYWGFLFGKAKAENGLMANNIWRQPAIRREIAARLGGKTRANGGFGSASVAFEGALRYMTPFLLLSAGLMLNNRLRFGKEEEERGRQPPHLDLGRFPDGRMMTWDRVGALPGLTSLTGMDDPLGLARDMYNGNVTPKEYWQEFQRNGKSTLISLAAQAKLPEEALTGRKLGGGPIRDRGQWAADRLHVGEMYRAAEKMAKLPVASAPGREQLIATLLGASLVDPAEEAYYRSTFAARDWIQQQKQLPLEVRQDSAWTPKEAALYGYRKSLMQHDYESAMKYVAMFAKARLPEVLANPRLGGQGPGALDDPLRKSLVRMEPLYGMPEAQIGRYLRTLTPRERTQVRAAFTYWRGFAAPTVPLSRAADLPTFIRETRRSVAAGIAREVPIYSWVRQHPAEVGAAQKAVAQSALATRRWQQGLAPGGLVTGR